MRVTAFIYDSANAPAHVESVLDRLAAREEAVDLVDVSAGDPESSQREAMLTAKDAVRIGTLPEDLFDDEGQPDFSPGALVTEEATGRRTLHVGADALTALRDAE